MVISSKCIRFYPELIKFHTCLIIFFPSKDSMGDIMMKNPTSTLQNRSWLYHQRGSGNGVQGRVLSQFGPGIHRQRISDGFWERNIVNVSCIWLFFYPWTQKRKRLDTVTADSHLITQRGTSPILWVICPKLRNNSAHDDTESYQINQNWSVTYLKTTYQVNQQVSFLFKFAIFDTCSPKH